MITKTSPEGGAYFDPNTRVVTIGADILKNGNVMEAVALRSKSLFGSEQTIAKLTRENRTLAENVDTYTGFEGDRVTNLSSNKDTVKNAHKLFIEPAHIVFMRHLKATSLYHGLGVFTDNFNRLFNLNVGTNANNPVTVRTALGQSIIK